MIADSTESWTQYTRVAEREVNHVIFIRVSKNFIGNLVFLSFLFFSFPFRLKGPEDRRSVKVFLCMIFTFVVEPPAEFQDHVIYLAVSSMCSFDFVTNFQACTIKMVCNIFYAIASACLSDPSADLGYVAGWALNISPREPMQYQRISDSPCRILFKFPYSSKHASVHPQLKN